MDLYLATSTWSSSRGACLTMSDPESGLRLVGWPNARLMETVVGCSGPVDGRTQLPDIPDAIKVDPRPTQADLPSENNEVGVSDVVFDRTYEYFKAEVPTRGDYTKTRPTIYKVPKELKRGDDDEGYEPVAVRIGPFTKYSCAYENSTAQLEKYKWCCVRRLLFSRLQSCSQEDLPQRDGDHIAGQLHLWLKSMKLLEPQIRASYCEDIEHNISDHDLAVNMLLDGCFILHRLLKYARLGEKEAAQEEDEDWTQVIGRVWVWQLVATDLVLRKLFELLGGRDDEPKDTLVKGSLELFQSLCPRMLRSSANSETDYHGVHVHHLLHLFYLSVAPLHDPQGEAQAQPIPGESDNIKNSRHQAADDLVLDLPQWIPCAKELEEAGVRFRNKEDAQSFLDIEFDSRSGILKIPPLRLFDFSDKLFRNLIAFEQTYPCTQCDVTTYAVFMDCLINTPEDMRILHLHGILVNQINGEQDASRFFSRICAQVRWPADGNRLKNVMDKVNEYRSSKLHNWRAALVRNYFSNPWVAISVLAAGFLLLMTVVQTTYTVYPYYKPPK